MKTQYYTAASLDGFIATEDHSLEWLFQLGHGNPSGFSEFIKDVGAMAMGSSTYEWLLNTGLKPGEKWPHPQPTWIFSSRSLQRIEGGDLHFVKGDVRPVYDDMRRAANGKNIWLAGGGDLVGQFYDAGLLDELIVTVASVTLGTGQPLLPRQIAFPPLKLTSARQFGTAFVELRYEVPKKPTD